MRTATKSMVVGTATAIVGGDEIFVVIGNVADSVRTSFVTAGLRQVLDVASASLDGITRIVEIAINTHGASGTRDDLHEAKGAAFGGGIGVGVRFGEHNGFEESTVNLFVDGDFLK